MVTLVGSVIALIATVAVALITTWQARRGARDSPYDALAKRVTDQEKHAAVQDATIAALRTEVRDLRDDNRSLRATLDAAIEENIAHVGYLQVLMHGVAGGTVPPWPPIPLVLQRRITPADLPPWPNPPLKAPPADTPPLPDHTDG